MEHVEVVVGGISCLADGILAVDLADSWVVIAEAVAVTLDLDVAAVKVDLIKGFAIETGCLATDILALELDFDEADVAVDAGFAVELDGLVDPILAVEVDLNVDVDRGAWVGL